MKSGFASNNFNAFIAKNKIKKAIKIANKKLI